MSSPSDLRRLVDSHIENLLWNILILPFGFSSDDTDSPDFFGNQVSLTNFVTFSGLRAREQKSNGTRGIHIMAASRRTTSDHCGEKSGPFDSSKLR